VGGERNEIFSLSSHTLLSNYFICMDKKWCYILISALLFSLKCLAQVPDSVRHDIQLPVIQQDTVPRDTVVEPPLLHPNDPLALADTAQIDSVKVKRRGFIHRFFKSDYPNPNKALYASLVFPAGGQIYNRRWWKAPIVWGGYAALIYSVDWNTSRYKRLREAYILAANGKPHEFQQVGYDKGDLRRLRDQFDKRRQLSYIGILILHIFQTAEAFVDCHLKTFDVSDDLSFQFKPSLEQSFASQYPAMGVGVAFTFGK
jgi:hypothetical protein